MAASINCSENNSPSTRSSVVFNSHGHDTPFLIGVGGGTASGKSTVCAKIMEKLGQDSVTNRERRVAFISQDCFYRNLSDEERSLAYKGNFDFDHPSAFDEELMINTLKDILDGKVVRVFKYNYKEHALQLSDVQTVYPADVVLFEGILAFYFPEIRDLLHMKLFVDTDSDTRLARRVLRDVEERGRDLENVLNQYVKFVKPSFEEFCLPTKKYADVIIPRGAENGVAIDLIVQTIKELLSHPRVHSRPIISPPPNLQAQVEQFKRTRHLSESSSGQVRVQYNHSVSSPGPSSSYPGQSSSPPPQQSQASSRPH